MKYSHTIQCKTIVDGKEVTGDWLMNEKRERISPVFGDLVDFFNWLRGNGFRCKSEPGNPLGVEKVG